MRVPAAELEHGRLRTVRPARNSAARRASTTKLPGRRRPAPSPSARSSPAAPAGRRGRSAAPARAPRRAPGSPAYIRSSRATSSADGSGSVDGAQVSTAAPGRAAPAAPAVLRRELPLAPPGGERAAEPAGRELLGPRAAALEHLLGVEMRALAVGQADGVDHAPPRRGRTWRAARQIRMQGEGRVERQRAALAELARAGRAPRRSRGRRAPARRPGRPCRRAGSTMHEADRRPARRCRRRRSAARARRRGGEQRCRRRSGASMGAMRLLSRSVMAVSRSAALEFGREQQQGEGLRAVGGALDLARGLAPSSGPRLCAARRRASTPRRRGRRRGSPTRPASRPRRAEPVFARGRSSRPARAPPSRAGRGPAIRRAGLAMSGALEQALAGAEQARRRDHELLGRLQLGRRRAARPRRGDQLAVDLARGRRRCSR